MGIRGVHHVTLSVEGVRDAESYYRELFDMSVLFREGELDEEYGKVPDGVMWEEAVARGVVPAMSFLERDSFALALADAGTVAEAGPLDHVALAVSGSFLEEVRDGTENLDCGTDYREDALFVDDRYGVEWELNASSPPPSCPFDDLEV